MDTEGCPIVMVQPLATALISYSATVDNCGISVGLCVTVR